MLEQLRRLPGVTMAEAAGSLRRRVETVGDLDLLVAARDAEPVMRAVPHLRGVASSMAEGPSKTSVRLSSGMQVDVRVVPPQSYGAALYYFTGRSWAGTTWPSPTTLVRVLWDWTTST